MSEKIHDMNDFNEGNSAEMVSENFPSEITYSVPENSVVEELVGEVPSALEESLSSPERSNENMMEVAEQDAILDLVVQKMTEEGEVITKEDLATSTDPVVQERFDTFLDRHPKVRKLVQIFALSTALGVPMAAQAQGPDYGRILTGIAAQAVTNEVNVEINSRIQRGQVQEQQRVYRENSNIREQQVMERFNLQQQQEQERFDMNRESARQQLMLRNPSAQQVEQFNIQWDSQYVQMIQRQKQTRETYMSNTHMQEQQQELRISQQNRQLEQRREESTVRNVTGGLNQAGSIFTQRIYRGY